MMALPDDSLLPLVSVIIAVHNGGHPFVQQLEALCLQDYSDPWELVVSDNGSTDETLELLGQYADRLPLQVVDSSAKRGVAPARNIGAAAAHGQLLLFCDCDDVLDYRWVSAMCAALVRADAVGGQVDTRLLNSNRARGIRQVPEDRLDRPLGWLLSAIGCNIGVRSSVFRALGGFDETFSGAAEDTDFCWRLQLAGYSLTYAPDALVHYRLRGDTRGALRQARHYGRARAQLAARYRTQFESERYTDVALTVLWAVAHLVDLVLGNKRRTAYLRIVAHLVGQIEGSRAFGARHVAMRSPRVLTNRSG